jgi:mitogen-activated protein kinase 1/3
METGKKVAIKKIDDLFDNFEDCKRNLREITLLRKLKHPCIVNLIEIIIGEDLKDFNSIYIVLNLADSDLKKVIRSSQFLVMNHIVKITHNLLLALKYVHGKSVLHRDIKPANVLINEDCSVHLCDFGLARTISANSPSEFIL